MSFTIDDKIKCLRREIALRKNVYPKWVDSGRMKKEDAEREIAVMQAIHDDLMALAPLGAVALERLLRADDGKDEEKRRAAV